MQSALDSNPSLVSTFSFNKSTMSAMMKAVPTDSSQLIEKQADYLTQSTLAYFSLPSNTGIKFTFFSNL